MPDYEILTTNGRTLYAIVPCETKLNTKIAWLLSKTKSLVVVIVFLILNSYIIETIFLSNILLWIRKTHGSVCVAWDPKAICETRKSLCGSKIIT